jgi:hypothetical protein
MTAMTLGDASFTHIREVLARVTEEATKCQSFQEGAQAAARRVYSEFSKSLVLVRIYAAVRHRDLPERDRKFVADLKARTAPGADLRSETPVVSLMGTSGTNPLWLDRYASQGHLAIPILSEAFVQDIPMMWKLLTDLGVSVRNLGVSAIDLPKFNGFTGIFHVANAATARDSEGRFVIPAREFIQKYDVHTVFGVGGSFNNGMVVMALMFMREEASRAVANRFLPLVRHLAEAMEDNVASGRLFPPPSAGGTGFHRLRAT